MLFPSNEATFNEFVNFGFNCRHNVGSKLSLLLINWFTVQFNVDTMHSHMRVKTRYVFIAPSKDIYIFSYERFKVLFLCVRQTFVMEMSFGVGYFILGRRLTLFEMFLPLKIQLMSPWISIKWLNVFVLLHLTD